MIMMAPQRSAAGRQKNDASGRKRIRAAGELLLAGSRNEDGLRRLDIERCRKAALVHGQPHMSARIDIQQRLVEWHIAKGFDEWEREWFIADLQRNILAAFVSQFLEVFSVDIRNQVSKRA